MKNKILMLLSLALLSAQSNAYALPNPLVITKDKYGWLGVTVMEVVKGLEEGTVKFYSGSTIQTASELLALGLLEGCKVESAKIERPAENHKQVIATLYFSRLCNGAGDISYDITGIDNFPYLPK